MPIYHGKWTEHSPGDWSLKLTPPLVIPGRTKISMPTSLPPPAGPYEFDVQITFVSLDPWWKENLRFVWRVIRGRCIDCGAHALLPSGWCRQHHPRWRRGA